VEEEDTKQMSTVMALYMTMGFMDFKVWYCNGAVYDNGFYGL